VDRLPFFAVGTSHLIPTHVAAFGALHDVRIFHIFEGGPAVLRVWTVFLFALGLRDSARQPVEVFPS
jgi:hypothetical protein